MARDRMGWDEMGGMNEIENKAPSEYRAAGEFHKGKEWELLLLLLLLLLILLLVFILLPLGDLSSVE